MLLQETKFLQDRAKEEKLKQVRPGRDEGCAGGKFPHTYTAGSRPPKLQGKLHHSTLGDK